MDRISPEVIAKLQKRKAEISKAETTETEATKDISIISPEVIFEICREYRSAADRKKQIQISSELHLLSKDTIIDILRSRGYNPPVKKPRQKERPITYNGVTKSAYEWSKIVGIPYNAIKERIRHGWSDEKILTTPLRTTKRSR